MWAGLLLGTISTSVLVANFTGLSTSPLASSAAGCFGLAAANTSAGAPCSMSVSSAPEPPKVYLALGSIWGNTFVSDAAASTVGTDPPLLDDVLVELDVVAAAAGVELELLLLPHAASADTAIAASTGQKRRAQIDLITTASLSVCQNPGTLTESWQ